MFLFSMLNVLSIFVVIAVTIIITIALYMYIRYSTKELSTNKLDIDVIDKLINERKRSTIKRRKVMSIIKNVIFYTALVIIIPFLVYAILAKVNNQNIPIGKKIMMVVGSGSMSYKNEINDYLFDQTEEKFDYQFQYGDIIFLDVVESSSEIEVYDVICYYDPNKGENIIHRVIEISGGKYHTRGDAWNNPIGERDAYESTIKDVVGKYNGKRLAFVGRFILFLQTSIGLTTILALFYLVFVVDYFLRKYNKIELEKMNKFASLIGYDELVIKYKEEESELDFDYIEIMYLGYQYKFNNQGFIEKNKILDEDLISKTKNTMIKKVYIKEDIKSIEYPIEQ